MATMADERLDVCVMMLQVSLAPAIHAHVFEQMAQQQIDEGIIPAEALSGE